MHCGHVSRPAGPDPEHLPADATPERRRLAALVREVPREVPLADVRSSAPLTPVVAPWGGTVVSRHKGKS